MMIEGNEFCINKLLASYPRHRIELSEGQRKIYKEQYKLSREGTTIITALAQKTESWMHKKVAQTFHFKSSTLEIGAGTLNQLDFEGRSENYDVIEPSRFLYEDSKKVTEVDYFYQDIRDIPRFKTYDRIISVATLEHITDLPLVLAKAGMHLKRSGCLCSGIPSEGGFFWGLAWRVTTGAAYYFRTGFSYKKLMEYEHVNDATEIIQLLNHFFKKVSIEWFPLPTKHLSLFAYIEAKEANLDVCEKYLKTVK